MLLNFGEYPDYNNEVVLGSDKYRDSRYTQFPQATGKEYYHQSSCTLFNGEKEIYRNLTKKASAGRHEPSLRTPLCIAFNFHQSDKG